MWAGNLSTAKQNKIIFFFFVEDRLNGFCDSLWLFGLYDWFPIPKSLYTMTSGFYPAAANCIPII